MCIHEQKKHTQTARNTQGTEVETGKQKHPLMRVAQVHTLRPKPHPLPYPFHPSPQHSPTPYAMELSDCSFILFSSSFNSNSEMKKCPSPMPLPIPLFPNNEKHTVGLMYRPYFRTFKTKICHVIIFPSEKKKNLHT